jgi:hypothetical protein
MNMMNEKRTLIQWMGLLGVLSLISYTAGVVFSPLAYPGYDWMSQAVSDLSAVNAPSRMLWSQLTSLYGVCGVVSITMACIYVQDKLNPWLRLGVYLFAIMNWVSNVGYTMFPLSESGTPNTFQDLMHAYAVTLPVVLLSIASLVLFIIGGIKEKKYRSMAIFAAFALGLMFTGAIGVGLVPEAYFGVFERFSVFSATGFNAILGIYLFMGFHFTKNNERNISC